MPSTFLKAKQEILRFTKRPTTDADWLSVAGDAVNESIVKLQRIIPNLNAIGKTEGGFTYTANTKQMSFSDVDESTDINKIISVDKTTGSDIVGQPLRCYTYEQFTSLRLDFEENKISNENYINYPTFEKYVSETFGHFAIIIGSDLMLYPTPVIDTTLAIHYTPWLAELVADNDTNLLLKYCWDFILFSSLYKINVLLSEGERIEISGASYKIALAEVTTWNSSLAYSHPIMT